MLKCKCILLLTQVNFGDLTHLYCHCTRSSMLVFILNTIIIVPHNQLHRLLVPSLESKSEPTVSYQHATCMMQELFLG